MNQQEHMVWTPRSSEALLYSGRCLQYQRLSICAFVLIPPILRVESASNPHQIVFPENQFSKPLRKSAERFFRLV